MPYVEFRGAKLWYEDSGGAGTPVLFVHAHTGNTEAWVYQLPTFTGAGYRCVTYDRRGWGRSEDASEEHQIDYAIDDLHALVQHLGLSRFHLVSTGGGGSIALDYAVSYPEGLRSMVVSCNGGGHLDDPEYKALGSKYGRIPEFQSLPAWFREIGPTYRVANPEGVDRWVQIEQASRHGEAKPELIRNRFTLTLLETIQAPTFVIAAAADLYAAPPKMRTMADHIADCQFALMPEAGHAAYWEQPETWNRLVLDFIREH
jgi:pimeloyl-ACP methyl ester carboxylesterase